MDIEISCVIDVPYDGYEWVDGRLVTQTPDQFRAVGIDLFRDEPALFAKFAATEHVEEEHVLEFANQYGAICRTLKDWRENRDAMAFWIQFWQEHKGSRLWENVAHLQAAQLPKELKDSVRREFGRDKRLEDWLLRYMRDGLESAKTLIRPDQTVYVRIEDPVEMLKIQLAGAITDDATLRYCEYCGAPFLIIPPSRGSRIYCARGCAMKASQKRYRGEDKDGTSKEK